MTPAERAAYYNVSLALIEKWDELAKRNVPAPTEQSNRELTVIAARHHARAREQSRQLRRAA